MLRYFQGYLLFPLLEKISKRKILTKFKYLKYHYSCPYSERKDIQKKSLYKLLQHCNANIPYYSKLFKEIGFHPDLVLLDINNFKKIPLLTKEIVRENCEDLKRIDIKSNLHVRKTGGSTGQSAFFFYDNEALDWTSAVNLLCYKMAGKNLSKRDAHLSGDVFTHKETFKSKAIDFIKLLSQNRKRILLSSFDRVNLNRIYDEIDEYNPYLLQGHPSTVYNLALFVKEYKNPPYKKLFDIFEPTGEAFSAKHVEIVEKYLLCKFVNRYGNAEFGAIAHTRMSDNVNKLQVFDSMFYVESDKESNVIVTGLENYSFPLLRYLTGDIAEISDEEDGQFISNIRGRIHDLVTINEKAYPTHFIMDFLDHNVRNINEFQVIYNEKPNPQLNIVPESTEDIDRIVQAIKTRFPSGLDVNMIDRSQLITVGWRNKFRHVVDLRGVK